MSNKVYKVRVKNEFRPNTNILLIGESPGEDEELEGKPFVGYAGQLLFATLSRYGITRNDVSIANLCQYRPYDNKFENIRESRELVDGVEEIRSFLDRNYPNVIVPLGSEPLQVIGSRNGITRYRGSIFEYPNIGGSSSKLIATYHPSAVARDQGKYPVFDRDIRRIVGEAVSNQITRTKRDFHLEPTSLELEDWTYKLCQAECLSIDIESIKPNKKNPHCTQIICIGFSPDPHTSIVLPYRFEYLTFIQRILSSPAKKLFHNGIFDTEMLYVNGMEVVNYCHDTLCLSQCYEPELPRSLDFLSSIYTTEPYYKGAGRGEIPDDTKAWSVKTNKNDLYIYNAKDTSVTFECHNELIKETNDIQKACYKFEMDLVEVAQHISRSGILVDLERRELFKTSLLKEWGKSQYLLNLACGHELNVNSPLQVKKLLYDEFGLPVRKKDNKISSDEDAIVASLTYVVGRIAELKTEKAQLEWKIKEKCLRLVVDIRGYRKMLSSYVNVPLSDDGRARGLYYPYSTETSRWNCKKYIDGTGFNAQTMPRDSIDCIDDIENSNFDFSKLLAEIQDIQNEELGDD